MAHASLSSWIKSLRAYFRVSPRGPRRNRQPVRRSLLLELLEQRECPAAFNPTDVLVVNGTTLSEYTSGGSLVQSFSVPYGGSNPSGAEARGVIVGPGGLAFVNNGNTSPYLSAVDPVAGTWTQNTVANWSLRSAPGFGLLGDYQQYVFAPSNDPSGTGIVRLDTSSSTMQAFSTANAYYDVTVGFDGKLYAQQALSGSTTTIDVYDPVSMTLLRSVTVAADPSGMAVDAAGNIFTDDFTAGTINEFSSTGQALGSLNLNDGPLTSIALSASGQIVAGSQSGDVLLTNTSLASSSTLVSGLSGGESYVAFVPQTAAPAITSANNTIFTVGNPSTTFTVQSTGTPTATLSESGALPSGLTFTANSDGTASITGTPGAGTGGVYPITITAHNGFYSDATQSFTLTVDEAPAITSASSTSFTVGTNGTFTVQSTGSPTATLSEAGTLPSGVSFTPNSDGTATLTGTPLTGTDGTYPITITAHNGVGNDFVQSFTLTVGKETKTTLSVTPLAPAYGQPVTLVASVVPAIGSVTMTGTVTFYDGNTAIATDVKMIAGKGTFTTTALAAGSHSFTAVYNGSGVYGPSTSAAVSRSVSAAATHVTLNPSSIDPVYGQPVTFTAKVSSNTPGTPAPTGTVTFKDGTTVLGTVNVSSGVAALSNQTLGVGKHLITAVFSSANPNEAATTSAPLAVTVTAARATLTVTPSPSPSVFGQSVTFTVNVNILAPGSTTPGGTITFTDGLTLLGSAPVVNGVATFSTSSLPAGTQTLLLHYGGDSVTAGTLGVARMVVDRAATTVALTSSPSTVLAGQTVTLTATVSVDAPGVATPTGMVSFIRNGVLLGIEPVKNGVATFTTQKLAVGTYDFSARYNGSLSCQGNTSTGSVTVSPIGLDATTITLDTSSNPSPYGTPLAITATLAAVNPSDPTPTGSVTFHDGTRLLGTVALTNGAATLNVSLASGTHSITATYSGDITFAVNTSAVWTQTVQPGTTTTLSASTPDPVFGQAVTFTARVNSSAFSTTTPTGTVTFTEGSTLLGAVNLVNGVATLGNQTLDVGVNAVTATFAPDNNKFAGSSSVYNETVTPARTTVALSVSPSPAAVGQSVTLTATVSVTAPGVATPTGMVTFKDGSTVLGSVAVTNGTAALTTSTLSAGSHTFTISYAGDADTAASGTTGKLTVNAAATTTDLSQTPQFGVAGQSITLTAQINVVAPAVATPTGTVTFFNSSGVPLGSATVKNGVATLTTLQKFALGTYTFTAKYSGDSHCASSSASAISVQMVNPPVISSLTLVSNNDTDASGKVSISGGDLVNASVTGSDPNSLPITYTYVWKVNGVVFQTDPGMGATDQLNLSTVPVKVGDTVTVVVTPNDGEVSGSASTSTTLTVTA